MRPLVTLALGAILGVSACAVRPPTVAVSTNEVEKLPHVSVQRLVDDTSSKLRMLYPPARTRFEIQSRTDPFGVGLIESLRAMGYAVAEEVPAVAGVQIAEPASEVGSVAEPASLRLNYIVDASPDARLYRVTLLIGNSSLSRAYLNTPEGALQPGGAWVRLE